MLRPQRQPLALGILCALDLLAGRAVASPDAHPSTDELYVEARAAFDAGNYDRACPLFAEYYGRDPLPGALFALAECESRWGKPARALAHFEEFQRRTTDAPKTPVLEQRQRIASDQIARLSSQVAKVTPKVAPDVKGSVLVKVDGVPVAVPAQQPVVVEPGEHTIELQTEAGTHEQRRFLVGAGESRTVEIGAAAVAPTAPPPREDGSLGAPVLAAGALGAAGLLVGIGTGAIAWAGVSDVHAHCAGTVCDATGKDAADRAKSFATVSTVGFAVGLAGAVAAGLLYSLGDRPSGSAGARVRWPAAELSF